MGAVWGGGSSHPPHFGQGMTPNKTIAETEPMFFCVSEQCPLCDLVRSSSKLGFLSAAKHDVTLGMKVTCKELEIRRFPEQAFDPVRGFSQVGVYKNSVPLCLTRNVVIALFSSSCWFCWTSSLVSSSFLFFLWASQLQSHMLHFAARQDIILWRGVILQPLTRVPL